MRPHNVANLFIYRQDFRLHRVCLGRGRRNEADADIGRIVNTRQGYRILAENCVLHIVDEIIALEVNGSRGTMEAALKRTSEQSCKTIHFSDIP